MWFSAKLLFEAQHDEPPDDQRVLREESIVLFESLDFRTAKAAIPRIAAEFEISYENSEGETVRWVLLEVLEIQDLCEMEVYSGMEVFSRLFWVPVSERPKNPKRRK